MQVDERFRRYDHVIVHCSATSASQEIGAAEIDKWHKKRGWDGCGYHIVIRRDGTIETIDDGVPTRPFGEQGAHVGDCGPGWNARSLGVCLIGGVDLRGRPQDNFLPIQMDALRHLLVTITIWFENRDHVAPKIMGHRDLIWQTGAAPKACPCFDVESWWRLANDLNNGGPFVTHDEDDSNASAALVIGPVWEVQEGDTLWSISMATGVHVSRLRSLNGFIANTDVIFPGDKINLR